ncbi:MAG: hypothetical protein D3923_08595 [Candidatus Electrothrix sp. AR3]|nr:hypothetical protein [Candidatus Electrothrix sp. AR3]
MHQKKTANKKVLLVANSSVINEAAIVHGLNFSHRMNASLEVLQLIRTETASSAAQSFEANRVKSGRSEQIEYIQLIKEKDLTKELIDYAGSRRNLLCVILCEQGDEQAKGTRKRQERFNEITRVLSCPVVLYTDTPVY